MIRKPTFLVLGAAAAALAAAGCGGGGGGSTSSTPSTTPKAATSTPASTSGGASSSGGATKLSLSADPSGALKFDKSSLSAKSGTVTITMDNPSSVAHGVAVEGNGVDKDGQIVQKGGKSTVTVNLKPGTYTFYCPVPGHKQAGMKGTLTVQ